MHNMEEYIPVNLDKYLYGKRVSKHTSETKQIQRNMCMQCE